MKNNLLVSFSALFLLCFYAGINHIHAQTIDLSKASVMVSTEIRLPVRETIIRTFQEEVKQRTAIQLPVTEKWNNKYPVICMVLASQAELFGVEVPHRTGDNLPETKAEGFRIAFDSSSGAGTLWLIGNDERSLFYAMGQFLRIADLSSKSIKFDKKNEIASSPAYPIRGHQLGYRSTNNTCDMWTVDQFEKYIRELVLFGCNSIENTPNMNKSFEANMKVSSEEMNTAMSRICDRYAIDYWAWVPATVDLSDKAKFEKILEWNDTFYKNCPRLDGVFIPGGDPGDNHPEYLIPFLEAVAAKLSQYHPKAGLWVSLQGFNEEATDYFFDYLKKNDVDWLKGVVSGPGSPDDETTSSTRFRLPKKYMHRHYPDITHTVRCQYPSPEFDQAFALTEGREACNPQPFFYADVHRRFEPFTDGSITYSDGVHDDINKILWTCLDWNLDEDVRQILKEYARFFFGISDVAVTDGILALEQNWYGPLERNGTVEATFTYWQRLETAHPELKNNWRWIQLLTRAYYDVYTQRRKIYEQNLEKEANKVLATAASIGADQAMDRSLAMVCKADKEPVNQDLNKKIQDFCEQLYRLIGMQTSVKKYHASGPERGCILDFIDYPLNNRWWLEDEFNKIRGMDSENEKLARLEVIRTWENPGEGSYYDNISDISQSPRVKTRMRKSYGYAWWDGGMSRKRLSTQLFQHLPEIVYTDLDLNATYTIRIAGRGEALLRVNGERIAPSAYPKELETFKEFHLSSKHIKNGKIVVTFDEPDELNLSWREQSTICDVWLLKNN